MLDMLNSFTKSGKFTARSDYWSFNNNRIDNTEVETKF